MPQSAINSDTAILSSPSPPLGGPHSQFPAGWNTTTAGLVKLGFAVLMGETNRISSPDVLRVRLLLMHEPNPIQRKKCHYSAKCVGTRLTVRVLMSW